MKANQPFSLKPSGMFAQPAAVQAQARFQQAWALHQGGQLAQALQLYEQVIQAQPKHFDALHLAGVISLQLGHADKAVDLITRALKIDRDSVSALNNRGAAYMELRQYDLALLNYNKAISLDPKAPKSYNNRGNTLGKLNRLDEALQDFDKAIELDPVYFAAYNNRATVLSDLLRYEEARASLNRAIELNPESVDAHWNLGMLLLRLGEFEQGWLESEWRLKRPQALGLKDSYAAPMWTGAEPLTGKTVLVCSEQGLGDTIQFCRYAPLLADMGARVVFEVQPALMDLLQHLPSVELIAQGSEPPAHDFHCPLMSLPMLVKTDLSNMPPPPDVIRVEPTQRATWQALLGEKRKPRVGLVWSGNPSHVDDYKRSIPLQDFAQILGDDIEWISLHKDVRASDQAVLASHPAIRHFGADQKVFTDAAAICELLDLIIAVDTSLAHLAATMGKPTWMLLAHSADWRWLQDRQDNPWYPSLKLYRQGKPGDWAGMLQTVRADLDQLFTKAA